MSGEAKARIRQAGDAASHGSASYVFLLTLVAALGGLLFGYDTGVISGAIGFLKIRFQLDAHLEGWATSSALVGCIIGACVAGALSDWMGRKRVLILSAVLFALSAIGSALPRSLAEFAIARMLGGFGVGAASMMSPLYIAEVSPARHRGRLVSVNQFTIVFGFLIVYLINAFVAATGDNIDQQGAPGKQAAVEAARDLAPQSASETVGEGGQAGDPAAWNVRRGWRWMFGSETLPALLFFCLLFFVPESPRWLIKRGRESEARHILTRVNGAASAETAMKEISETIAQEERSVLQLVKPGLRVAMVIGIALAILQQVTGINAVMYYGPEIFKTAGFHATAAIAWNIGVGIVQVTFTLVAIAVVDRVGRKPLLLIASAGMGVALFLLGAASLIGRFEGLWILFLVLTYVAFFAVAMGPVVWVVLSEIFPTRVRGTAMSVATVCLWIACFLVSQLFPWMLERLGGTCFFVYGAMCVVCLFFVGAFLPETKERSLEEIEKQWTCRTG